MSTTTLDVPSGVSSRAAARVAALGAVVLGVSLFLTVAVINVPHHASDAELVAWWGKGANRTSGVLSGMFAVLVAASTAVVANHLRTLPGASRSPAWLAFARSTGAAVTALWLVTGAVRGAVGHMVDISGEPLPGVDALRLVTALNYQLLGSAGMAALGLFIGAVTVVVLRTGMLPRWVGYVGVASALVVLAAVVAQYGAYTTPMAILWALCLAVPLWRTAEL